MPSSPDVSTLLLSPVIVHVMRQIDVGDSIGLESLAASLRAREPTRGAAQIRGPDASATAGVRLGHEPLDLRLGSVVVGDITTEVRVRLFEFGVVAFRFSFAPKDPGADALIDLSSRLAARSHDFDERARSLWADLKKQVSEALVPWDEACDELMEDFTVFVLRRVPESGDVNTTLSHVLFAEPRERRLARSSVEEVARRAICYYETDRVFVDYDAAVVVDDREASDLVDLFEVASAELLELRFYDAMLGRALTSLARDVRAARTAAWFFRSPFRELARRAAVLALDVADMTDRLERAITLVGDSYTVQVYRETALRFRTAETRASVREKLAMITGVADALGSEIHMHRDLVLELLVVALIAIEIVVAFK